MFMFKAAAVGAGTTGGEIGAAVAAGTTGGAIAGAERFDGT